MNGLITLKVFKYCRYFREYTNIKLNGFATFSATYDYVSTEVIGQSFEGVDMRILKICTDGCNDAKPAMFLDGGVSFLNPINNCMLYMFDYTFL